MAAKNNGKSMDIQKPGNSKPDSSSRPIIVTNRPILQDPMVKETSKDSEDEKPDSKDKTLASSAKTIEPPKDFETDKKEDTKGETPKVVKNDAETTDKPEEQDKPEEKQEEATEPELAKPVDSIPDEPEPGNSAVVDAVVAGAIKPGDTANAQQQEIAAEKRRQEVQLLIDSKKYSVPIGQVSRARHNRNTILFLIIIIALAAAYLVADMGIISVPFELPVQFFQ